MIVVVGFGLYHAAQVERDRAAVAARREAHDLAGNLRLLLTTPAVLAVTPFEARFEVRAGDVVVDAEVGWLVAGSPPAPDLALDERRRQAELAEFAVGDAAAAMQHYDELLAAAETTSARHHEVLAAAAWQAQRAQQSERAHDLLQQLLHACAEVPVADCGQDQVGRMLTAATLLLAARGEALPAPLLPQLAALPAERQTPLLQRLQERGIDTTPLAAAGRRLAARRCVLRLALKELRRDPGNEPVRVLDERLVLWFPGERDGDGSGAVLAAAWLSDLLARAGEGEPFVGLPQLTNRGRIVFTSTPDAEAIVPGLAWLVPLPAPELPWSSRPEALSLAGLGLVLVFTISALATFRGHRRATALQRTRAEFLTGVTHELKTPIAAIRLITEVLQDDDVPAPKQREYLALLAGEAARLSMLIGNVLDLGQLERGERASERRLVDLIELTRDALRVLEPLLQQAGMQLVVHGDPAPAFALADRGALTQAWLNLGENARKYAADGKLLEVSWQTTGAACTVRFRDHGHGVPAAEREGIFERFRRGQRHQHGSIPGVGLGLFLARSLVQQHGGTLVCTTPREGSGAEFVCTLPLATNTTNTTVLHPAPPFPPASTP
ncbi:MAG: HAMP domain-containing histidine kinase [Planctomycetes bacterium]|nr:HAMP domain-containing histidine kinase [Planctomycetota bacterium]